MGRECRVGQKEWNCSKIGGHQEKRRGVEDQLGVADIFEEGLTVNGADETEVEGWGRGKGLISRSAMIR